MEAGPRAELSWVRFLIQSINSSPKRPDWLCSPGSLSSVYQMHTDLILQSGVRIRAVVLTRAVTLSVHLSKN
jgi:hypothetical protein